MWRLRLCHLEKLNGEHFGWEKNLNALTYSNVSSPLYPTKSIIHSTRIEGKRGTVAASNEYIVPTPWNRIHSSRRHCSPRRWKAVGEGIFHAKSYVPTPKVGKPPGQLEQLRVFEANE
jgi:hypothetical protein